MPGIAFSFGTLALAFVIGYASHSATAFLVVMVVGLVARVLLRVASR